MMMMMMMMMVLASNCLSDGSPQWLAGWATGGSDGTPHVYIDINAWQHGLHQIAT